MKDKPKPTNALRVLLLPGWQGSGPGHWQSVWEARHGWQRVQQHDWFWPRRGDWMAQLEDAVLADTGPVLLAAHSLGCHLVAAWAAHSVHSPRVAGALLVAPPDLRRPELPPQLAPWAGLPPRRLPFASTLVQSADDPFCAADSGLAMAAGWGADVLRLGAAGHINADSGLGDWPAGVALLRTLAQRSGGTLPEAAG